MARPDHTHRKPSPHGRQPPDESSPEGARPSDDPQGDDDEIIDLTAEDEEASEAELEEEAQRDSDEPDHRQFTLRRDLNKRLDVYLQQRLKGISRSKLQQLIAAGGVTVNDRQPKASTKIKQGDVIDIILPPRAVRTIKPEPIPLHVLYEDDDFIIINKQAGLIVHPARSNLSGTLINGLAYRFKQQREAAGLEYRDRTTRGFKKADRIKKPRGKGRVEGLSGVGAAEFRPGIIHRLDRNTTGVLVVGKNDEAHWGIARQFESRTVLKAYLALVHGNPEQAGGVIEQPLGKHPTIREAHSVRHDSLAKHAVTLYRVREQYKGYALVELELKTGRTHQIRVHLSYLGYPIVGDILYGGEPIGERELDEPPTAAGSRQLLPYARDKTAGERVEAEAKQRPDIILTHPALHATLLQFNHPRSRQRVTFTAPLHEPFAGLVRKLRERRIAAPVAKEGYWVDLNEAIP